MKTVLTIDGNPSELARILAFINGSATVNVNPPTITTESTEEEDDNAPTVNFQPGQVDAEGMPWDERIHSNPAKMTGKNVWRKKRGVPDDVVKVVEQELANRMANQQPVPMPLPPTAPVAPPMQPPQPQYQQPVPMPLPPMQPPQPQYQQPVPQPMQPPTNLDFSGFMQEIQRLMQLKDNMGNALIDAPYLSTVTQRVSAGFNTQLQAITDLAQNPQMISYAIQIIHADGRWQ